ncbi:MAG: ABC transporter substrate-binding protein [Candidatus Dormibacteraeota bacterium]|uniref:ABC transporter substrate-binding protein n=1 Tax=Candidatus Amunia macphersoniae TaxID=3127014 RepID=A0A934KLS8_9BACT|nr:ABC transporter substrate-binding protein [Candidatus Dormibacteraeota bacterium]
MSLSKKSARLATCTALVLTVAACGTGGSGSSSSGGGTLQTGPGIDASSKTITVGIISPLTGIAAAIGVPLTKGQEAYFKHVNDNGGIDGWKINFVEKDDQYKPQLHVQFFNELLPQMALLAQSLGSPTTKAIESQAGSAKLVVGAAAQASAFVSDPVMAVIGTPYAIDVANGVDYIVNQQGHKTAKLAMFYQNDDYGADGLKGYTAAKSAYSFNDVGQVPYNLTDADLTGQAHTLQASGAEYVFVTALPTFAAKLVGTAAAMGYFPHWVFQGPAWSEFLMTDKGTAKDKPTPVFPVLAGLGGGSTWVLGYEAGWGDTSVPGMKQFLADHDKYFAAQVPDGYFVYGYCEAEMEVAVLKKAIESNDLTRQGILNAKLNLGSLSFGGLIPPLNYTPQLGPADRQTDIAQVDTTAPGFLRIIQPYFESSAAKSLSL